MCNEKFVAELRKLLEAFAKVSFRTQTLVAGMLVFVAFNFGQCDGDSRVNDFRTKYVALQKEATAAQKFSDSAKIVVAQLTTEARQKDTIITRLKITTDITNKQRAALRESLNDLENNLAQTRDTAQIVSIQEGIIYNLKDQVKNAESVIEQQKTVINEQDTKILKLDQALTLANERANRFEEVNKKLIDLTPPPKVWLNKKVLGATAFVAGVVVGHKM